MSKIQLRNLSLILILILAITIRLVGFNWDSGFHLHPDERYMTMVGTAIKWPLSIQEYFNPQVSSLSPYNQNYSTYIYGTFPLFWTKFWATLTGAENYANFNLMGRFWSAVFDTGSVLILFLIGKKLYNKKVALLTALFMALTVFHIQQSHFFTTDTFLVFFSLLTFYFVIDIIKQGRIKNFIFTGIGLGFALACKLSAVFLVGIIGLAVGLHIIQNSKLKIRNSSNTRRLTLNISKLTAYCLLLILVAYLVFRILDPYKFANSNFFNLTPNPDFWQSFNFQLEAIKGSVIFPPQYQWFNKTPYLFPLKNLALWGLGLPLGLGAMAGVLFMVYEMLKDAHMKWHQEKGKADKIIKLIQSILSSPHALIFVWISVIFLYQGQQFVKGLRYFSPILPFLVLAGAYFIVKLQYYHTGLYYSSVVFTVGGSLVWSLMFTSIYARPTTRVAASEWIYQNVPTGATIANEHWDDALPLQIGNQKSEIKNFEMLLVEVYNPDNQEKIEQLYKDLDRADYLVLSSNRAYGSIGRLPEKFPIMSCYYKLLFEGKLGFEKVAEFTSYPQIFGIEINDDPSEESFTVYDHPKVIIFKKTEKFSKARLIGLLTP